MFDGPCKRLMAYCQSAGSSAFFCVQASIAGLVWATFAGSIIMHQGPFR